MRPISLVREVLPPPRERVRLRTALPLLVFLVVFASACIGLELGGVILFTAPWAFLLSAVLPWFWWMQVAGASGLRGWRWTAALLVRLCLVGLAIALLAQPRAVRTNDVLSVVYALDLSDSIGESASDQALRYVVETVSDKPQSDEAGLVVFGRDAAVELPPRPSFPFETINARVPPDGTNLGKALSLAGAMIPQENLGRVVLVSDGVATEGALPAALQELESRGIPVDVLPVEYDYEHEAWLEKMELPRQVRVGETYEAALVLSSLREGQGTLYLEENGRTVYSGQVEFEAGKNRYTLPLRLREPGYYEYVARLELPPEMDGWQENNQAVGHIYLAGEGKVLLVTDPAADPRDWQPLAQALRTSRFQVERQVGYEFPADPMSLMPYDCVIFVNVPADAFDVRQLAALRDAVYHQGTGFLMVGGPNSYGPGGYHRTPVEEALPVTMDVKQKKVMPKGALAIVLHTCEFPQGNTWAKRITKEAIRVLGDQDEVGALAFSYGTTGAGWVFPMTPAAEYERLVRLVNQAQIGDMPDFGTTMQMGLTGLKATDAATRHMIIISDGDPSPPTPKLLQAFQQAKVSITTVVINPHNNQGPKLMRSIARSTGGKFYYPRTPQMLPSIFIKEAKTLRRSMIRNVTFTPGFEAPSPIMKGIPAVPQLDGYVLTTPRARALTVLEGPEKELPDPVLATWRYGTGKTAAFTADLSPNWADDWVNWDKYAAFVEQLVTGISRTREEGHLQSRMFASGGRGVILVEDTFPEERFLDVEAAVKGPHGRSDTVRLRQVGPRRYEGNFPLWGEGRYQVVAVAAGPGGQERQVGGFVVPYSPEYLRFRSNPIVLKQIARRTGGRLLSGDETAERLFEHHSPAKSNSLPIADWFLILLAVMVPVDVGVRRVQLDWSVIRGWFGRRAAESGETMQALLKRKREIELLTAEKTEGARRQVAEAIERLMARSP
ncbi:MAG: glutamine amidotransferase [Candidatus Brocadiia bacterium]